MDAQRAVARRMIVGLPPDGPSPAWEKDFAAYPPAGVILFARDFRDLDDLRRRTQRLRELARPRRLFVTMDEEGGFVSQLAGHLIVPPNGQLLSRGARPGDIEWIAKVTAERLRSLGVDWVFAPVADIHTEPRNPVIGPRAFGSDAETVSGAVEEVLAGFGHAGLAGCLKHFPGHGHTVLDSHLALPRCDASLEELDRRELVPFQRHLRAGRVDAVMTAHVVYPALDPEKPGTFSPQVVQGLLRERLGFSGVVITDALEMKGAAEGSNATEVARRALAAGCDLLLFAFHDEAVRRARLDLARAAVDGTIDRIGFEATGPRLAAFDRSHPEPTAEELSRPLESLTPSEWEPRLTAIIERGLMSRGALPAEVANGVWRCTAIGPGQDPSLAGELQALGITVDAGPGSSRPALEVITVRSRVPLTEAVIEDLRGRSRAHPVALVGLGNDLFLDSVPEAALRISAADATPLTLRSVARALGLNAS